MAEASVLAEPGLSFPEAIPVPNLPNSCASLYITNSLRDTNLTQHVRNMAETDCGLVGSSFPCWIRLFRCQNPAFHESPGRPGEGWAYHQPPAPPRAKAHGPKTSLRLWGSSGPVSDTLCFFAGNFLILAQREVLSWRRVVGIAPEGHPDTAGRPWRMNFCTLGLGPYNQLALGTEDIQPQASRLETVIKPLASKARESRNWP